jgi:hypothetical protein
MIHSEVLSFAPGDEAPSKLFIVIGRDERNDELLLLYQQQRVAAPLPRSCPPSPSSSAGFEPQWHGALLVQISPPAAAAASAALAVAALVSK